MRSSTPVRNWPSFWKGIRTASPRRCPARPIPTLSRGRGPARTSSSRRSGRCGRWSVSRNSSGATGIAGSTPTATSTGRWGRVSTTSSSTGRSLAPPFDPYTAVCDSYDLAIHKGESDVERSRRVYESLKIEARDRNSRHRLWHRVSRRLPLQGHRSGTLCRHRSQPRDAGCLRRQASRIPRPFDPDPLRGLLAETGTEVRPGRGPLRSALPYRRSRPSLRESPVAPQPRRNRCPHVQREEARGHGLVPKSGNEGVRLRRCAGER